VGHDARLGHAAGGFAAAHPRIGAEFMPQLDEGALWVRATMPYTISFDESAKITPQDPRHCCAPFPKSPRSPRNWAGPTTAPIDRLLQRRVLRRPQALFAMDGAYRTKAALIEAINEAPGLSRHHFQLHPAGRGRGGRGGTGLKSALAVKVFGSDLDTLQQKGKAIKQILEGCAASAM
jgi:heavy metal efflux system protein